MQESATLRQAAVPILRELANNASVYLMTHVIDDVGEATVRGALEDAGLIGLDAGQIKPHRVLFCSTLEGKVSIVRQLEPDLHIDGHPTTVSPSPANVSLMTRSILTGAECIDVSLGLRRFRQHVPDLHVGGQHQSNTSNMLYKIRLC